MAISAPRGLNTMRQVFCYDPSIGRKRYVGSAPSLEEAQELERVGKEALEMGVSLASRRKGPPLVWSLAVKGETKCRRCGEDAEHLHHLVPRRELERLQVEAPPALAGLPLCASCHRGWHHRSLIIYREMLLPEERAFVVHCTGEGGLNSAYPAEGDLTMSVLDLAHEVITLRAERNRLEQENDRLVDIVVRAGRLAESERASMSVQVLREIDHVNPKEADHG